MQDIIDGFLKFQRDALPQRSPLTRDFATRSHIDAYFQSRRLSPKIMVEANSISAVVKIVRYGRMATIMPDAIAREHGALNYVESSAPLPSRIVALLSRKGAYKSAASQAFFCVTRGRAR
jgi:LysR family cyn operon transcriptional activator